MCAPSLRFLPSRGKRRLGSIITVLAIITVAPIRANAQHYVQTNLVSDIPGLATTTDPNLVNPWGLTRTQGTRWLSLSTGPAGNPRQLGPLPIQARIFNSYPTLPPQPHALSLSARTGPFP